MKALFQILLSLILLAGQAHAQYVGGKPADRIKFQADCSTVTTKGYMTFYLPKPLKN